MTNTTIKPVNYSKSVSKMNIESLILFVNSKEFRNNYGTFTRAKSKKNFIAQARERLECMIQMNQVPEEFRSVEGYDKTVEEVQRQIANSFKGLVKSLKTENQLKEATELSHIESTVNFSRTVYSLLDRRGNTHVLDNPFKGHLWQFIKTEISKLKGMSKEDKIALVNKARGLGIGDTFVAASKYLTQDAWNEIHSANILGGDRYEGVFISRNYKGLVVSINLNFLEKGVSKVNQGRRNNPMSLPFLSKFGVGRFGGDIRIQLNTDTLKSDYLALLSKVIFIDKNGMTHAMPLKGDHCVGVRGMNIHDFTDYKLSLFDVMGGMSLVNFEESSLRSSDNNWGVIVEEAQGKGGTKFVIPENPSFHETILELNNLGFWWGISNPDTLHKGIMKSPVNSKGFSEVTPEGIRSMAGTCAKTVARFTKLVKEGLGFDLGRTLVVVDTNGNERARKALSTGVVHTHQGIWNRVGQVRITSSADQGGLKGTLAPMELVDYEYASRGYSLISFGSLKSNAYGMSQILGLDESNTDFPVKEIVLKNFGKTPVKVVELSNIEVVITNSYTIQQFRPNNRDSLLADWDMSNQVLADRVTAKVSLLNEDEVFVKHVSDVRDSEFGGDLSRTLEAMLARGEISRKPNTVKVTSSEPDMMAMCTSKDKAIEWIENILSNEYNSEDSDLSKHAEFKRTIEYLEGSFTESRVKNIALNEFLYQFKLACDLNGINPKQSLGAYLSRDFLVELFTGLFEYTGQYDWLRVSHNNINMMLPLGDFLKGDFDRNSNAFDERVAVTGFVSKLIKYISYPMSGFIKNDGAVAPRVASQFFKNVDNELYASLVCKDLGKFKVRGLYAVLSSAWWTNKVDSVVLPGKANYSDSKKAVACKHPLLFDMSLAGVNVYKNFPEFLTEGFDKDLLKEIGMVFGNTSFISEEMLLDLQNDCDGDLMRLSWHEGFSMPNYSRKTVAKDAIGSKWFNDYVEDERSFDKIKKTNFKVFTPDEIALAMKGTKYAKDCVAKFTNNAQLFAQRCEVDLGLSKDSEQYHTIHRVLNIWVQEFSMNAIKHIEQGTGDLLPDGYLNSTLRFLKLDGTELNEHQPMLLKWLKERGMDMSKHGFKNNLDFAQKLHFYMCNLQKRSFGCSMIGKDVDLGSLNDENRISTGPDGVKGELNSNILQDLFVLKMIQKLDSLV